MTTRKDIQRRNVRAHDSHVSGPTQVSITQQQHDGNNVRMAPMLELAIVGGLGVLILVAPTVSTLIKLQFQRIKARIILLKNRVSHAKIAKTLEVLNRRRKNGSVIRVIGSILPNTLFTPPCRIYIPNWAQLETKQWSFQPIPDLNNPLFDLSRKVDLPSENDAGDGLIEAFEINSDAVGSVSEDGHEEDEDTASSTPEGWTREQRRITANYNPTLMNTLDFEGARCSTPLAKAKEESLNFNATQIVNQQSSRIHDDQVEITAELMKMVAGLVTQINHLNQSIATMQNQQKITATAPIQEASTNPDSLKPQPVAPVITTGFPAPPGPPPPPPPPPPPMPPMPSVGNKPLIISKKGNQNNLLEKKPQISLSDVLKELPNAKLRRIERSPGGTPLKPQLKLARDDEPMDIGKQLTLVLKKRYESMHSPACDTDTDKENMDGSDDSFEDKTPVSARRKLFPVPVPRSPRRRSSGGNSQENRSPFGQHILKRRSPPQATANVMQSPPSAFVLRQQN